MPSLVEISKVTLEKKIALFRYHIPFGKGGSYIWIFVTQGSYFVLSLLEICPVFLEKIFYILFLLTLSLLSPLAKGRGPSIGEIWYPFTQGCFVPNLVEKGAVVPEDGEEEENVYDYDDGQRNIVISKLTWAIGSIELIVHLYWILLIFP